MAIKDDARPDPDALLAQLAPAARGKLKIFLGAAPGVGKTFEMLAQANRKLAAHEDVVAGVIETHGRAETAAQIGPLPLLPRHTLSYRGRILEEFDLDAALKRRPALLLVDELAHTNAPGSRHAKRWEDVADLVAAGVSVWATLNIQHLESLNDDIARATGVRPAETLPDRVLEMADEIELVDLPPAELRQRLEEGKIYRAENARRALNGFFREGNLTALREIALRRAAAHVDTHMRDWMRRSGVRGPYPASDFVAALVDADESAGAVVRRAKTLADLLHAPWVALHAERPDAAPVDGVVRRALTLATQLGAEIEVLSADGGDMLKTLLAAAQARNITHLVVGRGKPPAWRRMLGLTFGAALLRRAPDFVLHVVPRPDAPPRRPSLAPKPRPSWWRWTAPVLLVTAITAAGVACGDGLPVQAADMVYMAAVVACAAAFGSGPALLAAGLGVLAWDFFFIPPIYTVTISDPRDLLTAAVFAGVAMLTGSLAGRARAAAKAAAARVEGLRRIGAFSRHLGAHATEGDLLGEIAIQAAGVAVRAVVLTGDAETLSQRAAVPAGEEADEAGWAAARWAFLHGEPAGNGTSTLPASAWRFLPLQTVRGRLGVLGVRPDADLDPSALQALETLSDQAAAALERVRLAGEAARLAALEDTQRLRTALLASLGHDLRTPLTSIQGAAGTLRTAWDHMPAETRADLLASIEQDVGRMAGFLANLADLTRLETGEIRPRLGAVKLHAVVEAAVARLRNPLFVAVQVPEDVLVTADSALLEQAIFNVLDNAMKYAPEGSLVRVDSVAEAGAIRLDVSDEGVGIPAADLPHVFDSFFRVSRGDRTAPGTGLGLAIARGLLEAMGGRISALSPRPDRPVNAFPGTVISIVLPVG